MEKDVTILGKFYLKNGAVIEDKVVLDKQNTREAVDDFINRMRTDIRLDFRNENEFVVTFGFTVFRGSELAAVTIEEVKED